jgi:hypothetical protein
MYLPPFATVAGSIVDDSPVPNDDSAIVVTPVIAVSGSDTVVSNLLRLVESDIFKSGWDVAVDNSVVIVKKFVVVNV